MAVVAVPVKLPENVVAVMIPADIVMSVSTLSSVKVETPEEALMFDVIKSGNLASSIVPVVILAPSAKLVAVVAVPVTSPVRAPLKVRAVTIPEALIFSTTDKSFSVN